METKLCKKCGIEKLATTEFFHASNTGRKYKDNLRNPCKECRNESHKLNYANNKSKVLERGKRWIKKDVSIISDTYVKRQLSKQGFNDPPKKLIQFKRLHIKLSRAIKQNTTL